MADWSFLGAKAVFVHPDSDALAEQLALKIVMLATETIDAKNEFHLVLTGGTTPQLCYQKLAKLALDWSKVYLYMVDERCLPQNTEGRNDLMAEQALWSQIGIPKNQLFMMPAELGPELGATNYAEIIQQQPVFDLVLLGMGEDGHTASLFPGHETLLKNDAVLPVYDSPKPPAERITLGFSRINSAHHKWFMVTGKSKRDALARIQQGELLPAAMVQFAEWYLDLEACPER